MFKANDLTVSTSFWTRQRFALAWVGIVAAFLIMRMTTLSIPLERDEGEYAYIAQQILHGAVPYRDAFDQKPPGVFLIYLIGFALFGQSTVGIHLFMHLWTIGSAVLLYRLVSRFSGTGAGLAAALALVVMTAGRGVIGTAANTEIFMILPMIGSLLCVIPRTGRPGILRLIAAGALGACACWIKQIAAMDLLLVAGWVLVWDLLDRAKSKWLRVLVDQLCIAAGAAIVSAVVLGYFAIRGAMHDFWFCVFTYNFHYSSTEASTFGSMLANFGSTFPKLLAGDWPYWLAMFFGLILLYRKKSWRVLGFYCAFFITSFIGVCVGGYFRPHYYTQILPALAGLAGVGIVGFLQLVQSRIDRQSRILAVVVTVAILLIIPIDYNGNILFAANSKLQSFRVYGPTPFIYSPELGEDLRSKTSPDDTILIMGTEPQILFYAQRRSASRYIFFNPLGARYEDVLNDQKQALHEIDQNRPKYIVDFMRLYQDTIFKPDISEPYFLAELQQWGGRNGYQAVDFWIERTYEDEENFPQCYERLTLNEAMIRQQGRETTYPLVLIYARPTTAPANR